MLVPLVWLNVLVLIVFFVAFVLDVWLGLFR